MIWEISSVLTCCTSVGFLREKTTTTTTLTITSLVILNVYSVKLPIIDFVFFFWFAGWTCLCVWIIFFLLQWKKERKKESRWGVMCFISLLLLLLFSCFRFLSLSTVYIYIYIYCLFILRGSTSVRSYRLEKEKRESMDERRWRRKVLLPFLLLNDIAVFFFCLAHAFFFLSCIHTKKKKKANKFARVRWFSLFFFFLLPLLFFFFLTVDLSHHLSRHFFLCG